MYIRTEDGRIIDPTKIATGSKYMDFATNDESFRKIFKTEPLLKSENLEDLCDEFVMTHYFKETNYTHRKVLNEYEEMNLMIKAVRLKKINNKDKERKNEFNIYGCIWIEIKLPKHKTVFRLEPVVIMNDKGDFELI